MLYTPQTKLHRWSCMACAFAWVLGISEEDFYKAVGHDGSEIAFEGLPEPSCRRGFHIQECIDVCLKRHKRVTPIELLPVIRSHEARATVYFDKDFPRGNFSRFGTRVCNGFGVITGMGQQSGHAVAVFKGAIYDPDNGERYWYSPEECEARGFYPQCFWWVS